MIRKPKLSPQFWADLAANNPLGYDLTAEDVEGWFDFVWLQYRERHYKRHQRAIISWWSRVRPEDIERARARMNEISGSAEAKRLQDLGEAFERGQKTQSNNITATEITNRLRVRRS